MEKTDIYVNVLLNENVDRGFTDGVDDAIISMASDLGFDILKGVEKRTSLDDWSWDAVESSMKNYLSYSQESNDNHVWVALIDNYSAIDSVGAGRHFRIIAENGLCGLCGVNAACRAFGERSCVGDGALYYKNTIIQEILHTFYASHEMGKVNYYNEATPMITWYSSNNYCGDNYSVNPACNGEPDRDRNWHTKNITYCTESRVEEHYNYWFG